MPQQLIIHLFLSFFFLHFNQSISYIKCPPDLNTRPQQSTIHLFCVLFCFSTLQPKYITYKMPTWSKYNASTTEYLPVFFLHFNLNISHIKCPPDLNRMHYQSEYNASTTKYFPVFLTLQPKYTTDKMPTWCKYNASIVTLNIMPQ